MSEREMFRSYFVSLLQQLRFRNVVVGKFRVLPGFAFLCLLIRSLYLEVTFTVTQFVPLVVVLIPLSHFGPCWGRVCPWDTGRFLDHAVCQPERRLVPRRPRFTALEMTMGPTSRRHLRIRVTVLPRCGARGLACGRARCVPGTAAAAVTSGKGSSSAEPPRPPRARAGTVPPTLPSVSAVAAAEWLHAFRRPGDKP